MHVTCEVEPSIPVTELCLLMQNYFISVTYRFATGPASCVGNMTTCLLQNKTFYCREWVFTKLLHCLDARATAKTCGALVMGGPGSGKTALCCELVWPTASSRASSLTQHMLAYYFCQAHDAETLLVANFLHCLANQVDYHNTAFLYIMLFFRLMLTVICLLVIASS